MPTTTIIGSPLNSSSSILNPTTTSEYNILEPTLNINVTSQPISTNTTNENNISQKYYTPLPAIIIMHAINGIIIFIIIIFILVQLIVLSGEDEPLHNSIFYISTCILCLIFFIINVVLYSINKNKNNINSNEIYSYKTLFIMNIVFAVLTFIGIFFNLQ